jgi:seryl-tRNA synthetase
MAEFRAATAEQAAFLEELLEAKLMVPTGVPGVYGRAGTLEGIRHAFDGLVTRRSQNPDAERLTFPPVLSRHHFEQSGYLHSFPHLAGTVFAFEGDEAAALEQAEHADHHQDWSASQEMSEVVLTPAACYPVYPAVAARGRLGPGGVCVDTGGSYVYRHEPSGDPARLQMFHQREMVRIGEPETVRMWRDAWRDRALELLHQVGVEAEFDVASDPFFGRSGRMLAASQRQQALKFEILAPIGGPEPTAVASFNYHEDHFSSAFGLEMADGGPAHTACLGFGLERISLALVRAHGVDPDTWPAEVRQQLWPE